MFKEMNKEEKIIVEKFYDKLKSEVITKIPSNEQKNIDLILYKTICESSRGMDYEQIFFNLPTKIQKNVLNQLNMTKAKFRQQFDKYGTAAHKENNDIENSNSDIENSDDDSDIEDEKKSSDKVFITKEEYIQYKNLSNEYDEQYYQDLFWGNIK